MYLESKFDNCLHGTLFYSPSVLRWPVWGGGGAVKVTVVLVGQRDMIRDYLHTSKFMEMVKI